MAADTSANLVATAERLFAECRAAGYVGGVTRLRDYVASVRPRPEPEPLIRFETAPGLQAQFDFAEANRLVDAMQAEALSFVEGGLDSGAPVIERTLFMRYAGQGWDIPVPLDAETFDAGSAARIAAQFEREYERFFGRAIEGLDIEIVSWSVKASSPLPPVARVPAVGEGNVVAPARTRRLFEASQGAFLDAGIHERDGLKPGDVVMGPAVIVERETSTIVTSPFDAVIQIDGTILLVRKGH